MNLSNLIFMVLLLHFPTRTGHRFNEVNVREHKRSNEIVKKGVENTTK